MEVEGKGKARTAVERGKTMNDTATIQDIAVEKPLPYCLETLIEEFADEAYAEMIWDAHLVFFYAGDSPEMAVYYAVELWKELQKGRHDRGFRPYTPEEWATERTVFMGTVRHMVAVTS